MTPPSTPKRNLFARLVYITGRDEEQVQRGIVLNSIALFVLCASILLLPVVLTSTTSHQAIITVIGGIIVCSATYGLGRSGHVAVAATFFLTVQTLLIGVGILTSTTFTSAYGPSTAFLTIFVVASGALLGPRAPFAFGALDTVFLLLAIFTVPLQPEFIGLQNSAFTGLPAAIILVWIMVLLSWQNGQIYSRIVARLSRQTRQLETTNQVLDERRKTSASVSQNVRSLTYTLTSVATQQASGAEEQAAGLAQIESAIRELTRTAESITQRAYQVEQAARATDSAAQNVLAVTQHAANSSLQGQQAVEQSIAASEEVNTVYAALTRTLIELAERGVRIKAILDLTEAIAGETHLLALNAAIEASGAGQHGTRFAVVAQRVKELADRSREANGQITHIVRELQGRIQSAVMVAESGEKRARFSVAIARESGASITTLATTVVQAAEEAARIVTETHSVFDLARAIGQATHEQQAASSQILTTLSAAYGVASTTVETSRSLSESVQTLDALSADLNETLATVV